MIPYIKEYKFFITLEFFFCLKYRFSLEVFEESPEEIIRLKIQEETKIAKETAKKSRKGKILYNILAY